MTGAAKDAVDLARSKGEAVGLIKIKTFRPFPLQAMAAALAKVKRIGVVDRSVSFGWNCGPVYQETLAALYHTGKSIPAISFIGGLAGADITVEHFARAIALTREAKSGGAARRAGLAERERLRAPCTANTSSSAAATRRWKPQRRSASSTPTAR